MGSFMQNFAPQATYLCFLVADFAVLQIYPLKQFSEVLQIQIIAFWNVFFPWKNRFIKFSQRINMSISWQNLPSQPFYAWLWEKVKLVSLWSLGGIGKYIDFTTKCSANTNVQHRSIFRTLFIEFIK